MQKFTTWQKNEILSWKIWFSRGGKIFSHSMGVCLFVYFYLFIFLLFWLFILFNLYFSRGGGSLAFPVLPFWKRRHGKIFPFFLFERGDMRKVTIIQSLKNLSIDSCSSIIKKNTPFFWESSLPQLGSNSWPSDLKVSALPM